MGVSPRAHVAFVILGVALLAAGRPARAATLSLSDSVLAPYALGEKFDPPATTSSAFQMTDTYRLDEGHGNQPLLRYEDETEDATYFIETTARDGLIYSLGWTRVLSETEADALSADWLGRLAARFGLPDDAAVDGTTHAVAWTEEKAGTRLELILQPEDQDSTDWEVSAVVRRQVRGAK